MCELCVKGVEATRELLVIFNKLGLVLCGNILCVPGRFGLRHLCAN